MGSLATLDLPMVVDLIGIYGLKGPYSTLTTTDWSGIVIPEPQWLWATASCIPEPLRVTQVLDSKLPHGYSAQCVEHEKRISGNHIIQFRKLSRSVRSDRRSELRLTKEFQIWSLTGLTNLPQSTEKRRVLETPVGARHKCQTGDLLNTLYSSKRIASRILYSKALLEQKNQSTTIRVIAHCSFFAFFFQLLKALKRGIERTVLARGTQRYQPCSKLRRLPSRIGGRQGLSRYGYELMFSALR
ncbi:pentatricopeptide repeat-containing protein chloroplastic [Dorcoceras hygrometricum]|uniref:Pentatricopeptide repeat-containing protein chloroplastic n=1 Tax=Dorcoceras hygrometricum TaxID=472368 RepID=A0A2Z7CD35_9LAMI|nr:pentatricopeptide repeat-containing protein chloroplastic [Dorcoceras hygrometricum]